MPTDKDLEQAGFFLNRVAKRDRHLGKKARRSGSDCYRVYDRDIPEIPLALDRYGDDAVLYLFERPYDKPEADEVAWLGLMAEAAAAALDIPPKAVRRKVRRRLGADEQYERSEDASEAGESIVRENGLRFLVRLDDYIDTGLFLDHRPARELIRAAAAGKRVLNLFCYTGSFSVYALAGGAAEVVGVDLSNTYLAWAERNVALNRLDAGRYRGARMDAAAFLAEEAARGGAFDLIVLDPPTFSNSKKMHGFLDLARHWPRLVEACLRVLSPDGTLLFSSNAKGLKVDPEAFPGLNVDDISERSIPEGFRGLPHKTWLLRNR